MNNCHTWPYIWNKGMNSTWLLSLCHIITITFPLTQQRKWFVHKGPFKILTQFPFCAKDFGLGSLSMCTETEKMYYLKNELNTKWHEINCLLCLTAMHENLRIYQFCWENNFHIVWLMKRIWIICFIYRQKTKHWSHGFVC